MCFELKDVTIYHCGSNASELIEAGADGKCAHVDHTACCLPHKCRL